MTERVVKVGFIPLVDAAPLIVAQEMGFAAQEGLQLDLIRTPSWSALRELLSMGSLEAAHMLAPIPIATALGLGGDKTRFAAISVLSVNGNVAGVSGALAQRLRENGHTFDFQNAASAGQALLSAANDTLRIGVPFPFSMHTVLLQYWLSSLGVDALEKVEIKTIPPRLMPDAIKAGEIDAFCVGEPWGTSAVENGVGELLLPTQAIWSFAPEKVIAVREDWLAQEEQVAHRLVRAVWRAGRWLADPASRPLTSELLARPEYLDLPAEWLDRPLSGRLVINAKGDERDTNAFLAFHEGAATFPWKSQAEWIGSQLARRHGLAQDAARRQAANVFRSDVHRAALAQTTADLPSASSKTEGALGSEEGAGSVGGRLTLARNLFFDGQIFDPNAGE